MENLSIREILKDELCTPCKGLLFSDGERQWMLEQLRMENILLNEKYQKLSYLLDKVGISVSKIHSLPPAPGSSLEASAGSLLGQWIGGYSLEHDLGSRNLHASTLLYRFKEVQECEKLQMFQTVVNAFEELTSLLVIEPLWIKDHTHGRYIIHRDNYEKTFPRISHLKCSRARFESSREEGIVRMKGTELVGMLMDSTKRPDLFPNIIIKAMTIQELGAQSGSQSGGSLQLVYEEMHVLSPMVAPREFYCLRHCKQINEGEWIIVDISYECFTPGQKTSPFCSWKLPSGCFIKDLSNGCSKIIWVEHVQVNDKALTHPLCRDFVFLGLAYGAERWLLSLQRMCERFACEVGGNAFGQEFGRVISTLEGRTSIMNLAHRMVKNLCANLTMKRKLDIPQLSELNRSGIHASIFNSTVLGQPQGLIVNVATSLWLPQSSHTVFDFLSDEKMRYQWDAMSKGNPFQQIASIPYSNHPGNRISVIQALIPSENNMLVLQESCFDPMGAIIVYAPINIKSLDMAASGADSSTIPILPSGFIISGDGSAGGSLVTVAFQLLTCGTLLSKQLDMQLVARIKALVCSTVQNIKSAFNCHGLD